jgi:superfamily II DNA or RNA helicase
MSTDPRRFGAAQRVALFAAAEGKCELCGDQLKCGWHADHVHPYSRGGRTDVSNGAALCPSCNAKKGNVIMDPREKWQNLAVDDFLESRDDFLVTACPGAGKTRMALKAARALLDARQIDRVIVVAPTIAVRRQWAVEANKYGLDLTEAYKNGDGALPADSNGAVTVYAQVAQAPFMWRILASRGRRSLVILDEVHHAADADHTSWGPAIRDAFSDATRRLLLSGTPFRTDGTAIPFVRYDSDGRARPNRAISYGEAVGLGIVRPVRFEVMDGAGEWARGAMRARAFAASATESDYSSLLTALYSPSGNWMRSVMVKADDELTRIREEMPTAGGVLIAENRAQAKAYQAILRKICGEPVDLVVSDDPDAHAAPPEIIANFRDSDSRWIVAVDLISEGVDIPRLAVVLFASRKRTEMWFRQIVGRCVRRNGDDITATVFIPALPVLVDMAQRIEEEADAGLKEAVQRVAQQWDQQTVFEFDIVQPLTSTPAILNQVITGGDVYADEELRRALEKRDMVGGSLATAHVADVAKLVRLVTNSVPLATTRVPVPPPQASGDEYRRALRQQVNRAVARINSDTGRPHNHIHGDLNRQLGDTLPTASVETLQKRLEVLATWQ